MEEARKLVKSVFEKYQQIHLDGILFFDDVEQAEEQEIKKLKNNLSKAFKGTEIKKYIVNANFVWKAKYMGEDSYLGIASGGIDNTLEDDTHGYLIAAEKLERNDKIGYRIIILITGRILMKELRS